MRFLTIIAVLGNLLIVGPAWAEQGRLKVHHSTDSSGNSVIVIHETRPEVLSRQRAQIQQAQSERKSKRERELHLEIERLRAERELVEAETRRETARRAYLAIPRVSSQTRSRPSFFNGGLGRIGGTSGGAWDGGFLGGSYPGSSYCAPRTTPIRR